MNDSFPGGWNFPGCGETPESVKKWARDFEVEFMKWAWESNPFTRAIQKMETEDE